jgi:hypothetical protein
VGEEDNQPVVQERTALFHCGDVSYADKDVIDAALFRGDLEPEWQELLKTVECENQAGETDIPDGELDDAAEEFRYDHDLITAEETEHWLQVRGLTLDDFGSYFARRYWGKNWKAKVEPETISYVSAPEDLRELMRSDLILSGALDRMAMQLSWRVAGASEGKEEEIDPALTAQEQTWFFERTGIDEGKLTGWLAGIGRDREWLNEMFRMEAIWRRKREQLLTPKMRQGELSALRLPLTRFEVEMIEVESKDAAREAALCVTEDGISMEEVAQEGRYPFRRIELLLQEIDTELQQKFLSVTAGKLLDPLERGDGFHLCRIVRKIEPDANDPALHEKIDQSILHRHFSRLVADHIQWQTLLNQQQ